MLKKVAFSGSSNIIAVYLTVVATISIMTALTTRYTTKSSLLNIGDSAPALRPAKWLKGSPITKFEKGHIYVVAFWSTWQKASRGEIPHLTALAQKYPDKVEVIGMDVWESPTASINRMDKVESFVKTREAQMDYHVATDTMDNRVMHQWMDAASEGRVPTVFIIGKDSKIAWIGKPEELDSVLEQVVTDNFDVETARGIRAQQVEQRRQEEDPFAHHDPSQYYAAEESEAPRPSMKAIRTPPCRLQKFPAAKRFQEQ